MPVKWAVKSICSDWIMQVSCMEKIKDIRWSGNKFLSVNMNVFFVKKISDVCMNWFLRR